MVQSKIEGDIYSVDYSRCPITKTHRRLVEAHVLWHQTLEQYQQPELFHANLNATIQSLRNITFVLQSEKHSFKQFDDWYGSWQERMKSSPVLKWLIEARNIVVKQGELETSSTAIVKLVTWKDDILVESSVPPGAPPSLILRNIPLLELIHNTNLSPDDLKDAVIVIERRWSVPDLDGREILEALAQAYGLLSDLVLDAHVTLGETACISQDRAHGHFRSGYHRSGTLPCMIFGIERRTDRFKLSTGQPLRTVRMIEPSADPAIAAKRYGLEKAEKRSKWQKDDPLLFAERILFTAKRILRKDKVLVRILFIRDGRGTWHQVALDASNRTEKHLLICMVARFIESIGGDAIIDVGEVWTLEIKDNSSKAIINDIQHAPGRGEAMSVLVATREGFIRSYNTPFTRGPFGGIRLGDTVQMEEYQPFYLKPIFDVWRTQATKPSSDGKRIRRLWEPDPLETCFCGGPRRFAECCKRLINTVDQRSDIIGGIDEAISACDFARYEELARAGLVQYVIWVKQHTSPTRHVAPDLHRMFIEVDIPALCAHVRRLGDALETNGHADFFLPQLRHISEVIGVPEISIRLIALAVQWLLEIGDYSGAAKEIETLGNLENVSDTLALVLATQLLDLPVNKKNQFLTRAVSSALWKYERWLAELEFARHLSEHGEQDEATRKIDSVIIELIETSSYAGLRADAMSLRWYITKKEQDFRAAKNELEKIMDPEKRQNFAAMLIDHADYEEAEQILADPLTAGDPVAQLLVVDARTRANRIDAARELLQIIAPDRITSRLQYPYSVACAHVALACADNDLKKFAADKLRQLPSIGTRVATHVNDLLEILEGHKNAGQDSIMSRFRNLFTRQE